MELTPGVVIAVAVVVVVGFVAVRWSRRHEAAAPVETRAAPAQRRAFAASDESSLVTLLLERAHEDTGVKVADDALARQRITEAAGKAIEELRARGSATISLPFITADASGPKHFSAEVKRNPDSTFVLQR
jgi:hypothetical protein